MIYKHQFIDEVSNISLSSVISRSDLSGLISYETDGSFWDILEELNISLVISREYEHFLVILGSLNGSPYQSALQLPHPSGIYFNNVTRELLVSSTRTPNQIICFQEITENNFKTPIISDDFFFPKDSNIFVPYKSFYLPGDFRVHDVIAHQQKIYVTVTEHNFLAYIDHNGIWHKIWSPKCLDQLGANAFKTNYLQLNSLGIGSSLDSAYLTAFSNQISSYKPWKEGYGPKGKGVVFSYATRDIVCDNLTCPHSAKVVNNSVWLCNSGYGTVGVVEDLDPNTPSGVQKFLPISSKLNGFTRGLAFYEDYIFVGLSKVISSYEPYAPGLDPSSTICGIVILNKKTGTQVASLTWSNGYQIYDIQIIPGMNKFVLPGKQLDSDINLYLRYLG